FRRLSIAGVLLAPSTAVTSRRQVVGSFILCLVSLCLVSPGLAQNDNSVWTATVSDSAGHRLSGVKVIAIQDATELRREAVSSAEGAYYFPKMPVGSYAVTFDREDFQSLRFDHVVQ